MTRDITAGFETPTETHKASIHENPEAITSVTSDLPRYFLPPRPVYRPMPGKRERETNLRERTAKRIRPAIPWAKKGERNGKKAKQQTTCTTSNKQRETGYDENHVPVAWGGRGAEGVDRRIAGSPVDLAALASPLERAEVAVKNFPVDVWWPVYEANAAHFAVFGVSGVVHQRVYRGLGHAGMSRVHAAAGRGSERGGRGWVGWLGRPRERERLRGREGEKERERGLVGSSVESRWGGRTWGRR